MASRPHLLGQQPREGGFVRRADVHDLNLGVVVRYALVGMHFEVAAHRDGVQCRGIFPNVDRTGISVLKDILDRAVRHHEHLKTFEVGQRQSTIPEDVFEIEESQRDGKTAAAGDVTH